ncbi:M24 family metallopeptidase [Mycolicibacterium wolinskyi]|uniref:M24 family metallopeptidase n=1 Tax=Mycolicibacterium wolinskyi TaxID=59750 RepID=UPI003917A048
MPQLAFPLTTYRARLTDVQARMRAAGLDAMVITMPDAVHWLTGVDSVGYLWPQGLVVPADEGGQPVFVTRTTEQPGVDACSWLTERRFYDISVTDPVDALIDAVAEAGFGNTRLGLETDAFTMLPSTYLRIVEAFPDAKFSDCSYIVPEARLVKTEAELAYQRQAAAIADHAMRQVLAEVRPGVSELELAGIAARALGEAGGEHAAIPPMVVSGERSALVHCMAGRRVLGRGDVVCIELAGVVNRYHAVLMRTAVIGTPNPRVQEVAELQKQAHLAAVARTAPGVAVHEPEDAAREVLEPAGLHANRCHRIGYSLGVAYPPGWLEPMTMVQGDEHVFVPGMSFTVEPNLHLPEEGFGLKLGETVECTADGPRSMTTLDHDIFVV